MIDVVVDRGAEAEAAVGVRDMASDRAAEVVAAVDMAAEVASAAAAEGVIPVPILESQNGTSTG